MYILLTEQGEGEKKYNLYSHVTKWSKSIDLSNNKERYRFRCILGIKLDWGNNSP